MFTFVVCGGIVVVARPNYDHNVYLDLADCWKKFWQSHDKVYYYVL